MSEAIKEMDIDLPDLETAKPKWMFADRHTDKPTPEIKIQSTGYYQPDGKESFPILIGMTEYDKVLISLLGQKALISDLSIKLGKPTDWKGQTIQLRAEKKKWRLV
jgi:hypothetical protein